MQASKFRTCAKCLSLAFLLGCGVYLIHANMLLIRDSVSAILQQHTLLLYNNDSAAHKDTDIKTTPKSAMSESVYSHKQDTMQNKLASSPASAYCTLLRVQADRPTVFHTLSKGKVSHTPYTSLGFKSC